MAKNKPQNISAKAKEYVLSKAREKLNFGADHKVTVTKVTILGKSQIQVGIYRPKRKSWERFRSSTYKGAVELAVIWINWQSKQEEKK